MVFKFLSAVVLAAVMGAGVAQAQSVGQVGGPANLPPAGFQGEQWVDNRGCVFLKAGYGGQVTWVPRVGRDRRAMCGYPPSSAARAAIEVASAEELAKPAIPVEETVAAAPAPVKAKPMVMATVKPAIPVAPAPLLAPAPTVVAAPVVPKRPAPYAKAAPSGGYEVAASTGPSRGQIGCYTSAPVAERVKTRNGGTVVVCTRGDGTLTGWRPPIYPREAGVGAAISDPMVAAQGGLRHGTVSASQADYAQVDDSAIPTPPKGYKMAWDDGRLNPNRGKGTASGWQQQDQVWTRKTPAKLVSEQPQAKRKKVVYVQSGTQVTVSTKGQAATAPVQKKPMKAAKGGAYIQVGTFGVPSNADGAASRLKGLGLPVARAKTTSGGKAVQIVLAGPFGSAADAQAALSMARQAGFGDAFIR